MISTENIFLKNDFSETSYFTTETILHRNKRSIKGKIEKRRRRRIYEGSRIFSQWLIIRPEKKNKSVLMCAPKTIS
jgi:hypothetical protein